MIPLWLTALAFCTMAYITRSRTYSILAFSSICNIYIDFFTSSEDVYLMVVYSSIEFITGLAIFYFGDIHKVFQILMLELFLVAHFIMEYALFCDNVEYIESGIYTYTISGLIIAQLIGARRGLDQLHSLSWPDNHRRAAGFFNLQNHY